MMGEGLLELAGDAASDLRNLERMGEAGAIEIAVTEVEDLGLALQPPERGRVDHPRVVDVAIVARVLALRGPALAAG